MRYTQEKDNSEFVLDSNRRRLAFEMRDVIQPALHRARIAMEKEFRDRLESGEVMSLANDTAETRRFLIEGVFKELNNGTDVPSSISA